VNNCTYPISKAFDKRFEADNYNDLMGFEKYFIKNDLEEYVFNLNSYNLFHSVFENFQDLNEKEKIFTRNHVYTLVEFSKLKTNKIKEHDLISLMNRKEIGSCLSRHLVLENLINVGFFKKVNYNIFLTKKGSRFSNEVKNMNFKSIDDILFSFEIFIKKIGQSL
jgi:DNA topoisomerase IA